MWKDFFYFTRTQRKGIVLLLFLIAAVCLLPRFFGSNSSDRGDLTAQEVSEQEYMHFLSSLKEQKSVSTHKEYGIRPQRQSAGQTSPLLMEFDPNTADSVTFVKLGLPWWMARNILRYRSKNGVFRRPEDFRKIYGMTDAQFQTLRPYICIAQPDTDRYVAPVRLLEDPLPLRKDTLFKYPPGTLVDLNRADTTELKKIPGIGSAIARMIVDYRSRLGAFYRVEQLADIRLKVDKLRPWFWVDTTLVRTIPVNRMSVERLKRHPYLNFYQAKVINEHRKKKGNIRSLKELSLYEEFTPADLERIAPYLSFD